MYNFGERRYPLSVSAGMFMMRVITGSARGRRLETLAGDDVTRPTAESVKEALFSMLQFEIEGKRVLDLFAGSGQMGIEALSRGAAFCDFVENNKRAGAVVERNAEKCGFAGRYRLILTDAQSFAASCGKYDIVFLDPPYGKGLIGVILPVIESRLNDHALVACETSAKEELPENVGSLNQIKSRRYGKTKITLYRKDINR